MQVDTKIHAPSLFGYHNDNTIMKTNISRTMMAHTLIATNDRIKFNREQGLGYLPGAGFYTGAMKMATAYRGKYEGTNCLTKTARFWLFFRGSLEFLGLGIVFLIPDIIASVVRHGCQSKKSYNDIESDTEE